MDEDGVSPVLGTILVLAILTVVTATMLAVVWPQIQDTRDRGDFQVVSAQMGRLGQDMTQMALGGNLGEVRQRTVATSAGHLGLDTGHLWAVSAGLLDERYSQVIGHAREPRHHPAFNVSDHDGPDGDWLEVGYQDLDHEDPSPNHLRWSVHRFTGSDWQHCADCDGNQLVAHNGTFVVDLEEAAPHVLKDGPWRVTVFDDADRTQMIGVVFVFELNRIVYNHEGSMKSRGVIIENGAVFTREDNEHYSIGPGLFRTSTSGGGTGGLNMRAAQLDASVMPTTTGRAKTTFQLTLTTQEHLAHDMGAIHVRLQPIHGPTTTQWGAHLVGDGFDPSSSAIGVTFVWPAEEPGYIVAFPFSMIYSDIRFRMVSN